MNRRTIGRRVSLEGIGVHYGAPCRLSFVPAKSGTGVVFRRTDLPGQPLVPATIDVAVPVDNRTQLVMKDVTIQTPEHVLAAVYGCGIDDLEIEIDSSEPPILDGSSAPFVEALESAGTVEHEGSPEYFTLARPVSLKVGESSYEAMPAPAFELDVAIQFQAPIGNQAGRYCVEPSSFKRELAAARTFGFRSWWPVLEAQGLAKGVSLENTVVINDDDKSLSAELRWPDEFVRHKALDCIGDFALAGGRIRARIKAVRPSHRGNVKFLQAMKEAIARESTSMEIEDIMKVLAHRYPFLLVDRILEKSEKRVVGLKNVTINEPFFQGHFPGHPIMPGVLIIEAMAQVGGMLLMGAVPNPESKVVYFTSLNDVKWRRPVKPGDQLIFELEMLQVRGMMCKMKGIAKVDGNVVAEAEMGAVVRDK